MNRFRPSLGPTLATLIVFPILVALGIWQLDRAEQKRMLAAQFAADLGLEPVEISAAALSAMTEGSWLNVAGQGRYRPEVFLLDNRVRDRVVGYEVISPLVITSGDGTQTTVLTNRGWLTAGKDRNKAPQLRPDSGPSAYRGRIGPPPATGIELNTASRQVETLATDVYRVQNVDFDQIGSMLQTSLEPVVLYLSDDAPGGYRRGWEAPGFAPEKHEAYATQWFSMALIVLGLYVVLNWRSARPRNRQ